jgi:hypothetical protein
MTEKERKAWETFAARKSFAMRKSVDEIAGHPNFAVMRDGFLSVESSFDSFSEDLKKARYVLLMCDLARKIKVDRPVRQTRRLAEQKEGG